MNCNLSDQAGPGIKEEVTSPSSENREKFAASREKCFLTEDTPQKHDYIISSYEPLADLFFLYFNIGPNNNKIKINNQKKKMLQEIFLYTFNLFNTDFIFVLQGSQIRRVLKKKKKKSKKNYVFIKIMATFPCKPNKRKKKKKKKKKNQYLAHMTKTSVICKKKYTYYKIKFAHYYL